MGAAGTGRYQRPWPADRARQPANVFVMIMTPNSTFQVKNLTSIPEDPCSVNSSSLLPIDGAGCVFGWESADTFDIDFSNPE